MQPTGVLEKSKATKNPLRQLLDYGQSMWLDYIRRDLFTTGKLKQLIDEDGLRGMTSNPSIFRPMARTRTWFSSSSTTRTRAIANLAVERFWHGAGGRSRAPAPCLPNCRASGMPRRAVTASPWIDGGRPPLSGISGAQNPFNLATRTAVPCILETDARAGLVKRHGRERSL